MITLESLKEIFQGITSLFAVSPQLAFARIALILLGFLLMYLGRKGVLEALIMIPMGLGMATINAAVMFFDPLDPVNKAHRLGNLFVEPTAGSAADTVQNAADMMTILQIDWRTGLFALSAGMSNSDGNRDAFLLLDGVRGGHCNIDGLVLAIQAQLFDCPANRWDEQRDDHRENDRQGVGDQGEFERFHESGGLGWISQRVLPASYRRSRQ